MADVPKRTQCQVTPCADVGDAVRDEAERTSLMDHKTHTTDPVPFLGSPKLAPLPFTKTGREKRIYSVKQWACENYRGGGKLRGGIISPWDISQRVYFTCNLEFAVGNFAPTCCEPTFGWCWLWTGLLSIIFHPCKECSKLQAKFASVPCVQQ